MADLDAAPKTELRVLTRRQAIGLVAAIPAMALLEGCRDDVDRAASAVRSLQSSGEPFTPAFFDEHEWATLRTLVDYIIPADDRSGSATDAGVPEFIDFMMMDRPNNQSRWREGLAWMDAESQRRFGSDFVDGADADRRALLDAIAWPGRADPSVQEGVRFFNTARDMTSSGFWSSQMGVEDIQYIGNTTVVAWNGCPDEACRKLGVSYEEDWDR